jgi:hypothetical protein
MDDLYKRMPIGLKQLRTSAKQKKRLKDRKEFKNRVLKQTVS